jgi:hypothetical protein
MTSAVHMRLISTVAISLAACSCNSRSANEQATADTNGSVSVTPTSANPCAFVSNDEVAKIIGQPIVRANAEDDVCTYETDDAMASSVKVQIKRNGANEMQTARQATTALHDIGSEMKVSSGAEGDVGSALTEKSAAPDLGDEAFFGSNSELHVLKGDTYVAVLPPMMRSRMSAGNPMLSTEDKRAIAIGIADKVIAKLR